MIDTTNQLLFEDKVIEMLLSGNDEILAELRAQYHCAKIKQRRFTGRGFFTYFELKNYTPQHFVNGVISDVDAISQDNQSYHFNLFITDGVIEALEGVSESDDWIEDYNNVKLFYWSDEKRNYTLV